MTTPTVSVCIPTYNGGAYIERTIRSVLAQTFPDFELVVCDDGSTDDTLERVGRIDDARIRVVASGERAGAAANFQRAVGHAQGEYVKLLCQDDLIYADCLETQVAALRAGAEAGVVMVAAQRDIVDDDDRVIYRGRGWRGAAGVVSGSWAMRANVRAGTNLIGEPSAVLLVREVFAAAGGFDPSQAYMIDLDAWMRVLDRGDLSYVPRPLCTFRVSDSSWSAQLARQQARQARDVLRALHATHPTVVTRTDLALGLCKPTLLSVARRAVFAASKVMPDRSRAPAVAVDPVD